MSKVRHATDPVSGQRVEIIDDLVKRLRGLYAVGPTLPNGEPEFGWRQIGLPAAIQLEAANEIERLRKIAGAICPYCDHALCCAQCGREVPNDLNG